MGIQFQPASRAEIGEQIVRLTGAMPPQRGSDVDMLTRGYFDALRAFPAEAISEAVDGFFSGRFGEQRFCPPPPQLATYVRQCLPERIGDGSERWYVFDKPNSACLQSRIDRDRARDLVARGIFPKGSIWVPGDNETTRNIGDLYGPDPRWKGAKRFVPYDPKKVDEEVKEDELRHLTPQQRAMLDRFRAATGLPAPPPRPERQYDPSPAARVAAMTAARRAAQSEEQP